jgi:hypothetical protein
MIFAFRVAALIRLPSAFAYIFIYLGKATGYTPDTFICFYRAPPKKGHRKSPESKSPRAKI